MAFDLPPTRRRSPRAPDVITADLALPVVTPRSGSAYADRIIAAGASHYWRLNDASGTTAVASVGGVNGTLSGGVTLGQPGALADGSTAIAFNGSTGEMVTTGAVPLTTPFSLEFWVKRATAVKFEVASTRAGYPAIHDMRLAIQAGGGPILTLDYAGGTSPQQNLAWASPASVGSWHHLVIVLTSLQGDLYLNGVHSSPSYPLPAAFAGALYPLTCAHDLFEGFGAGALDELAIYPGALSAAEIAAHYDLRTALPPPEYPRRPKISFYEGAAFVDRTTWTRAT